MAVLLQNIDYIITFVLAIFFIFKLIQEIKNEKRLSLSIVFFLISIYFLVKALFIISILIG
ncbi:hypothetical protein NRS6120_13325 [Bacillus subtilis]|nr:hypothetical protein NRS6120_00207 [Bacillus subtilis]CAI6285698.1 hypothetical protein NRS6120_13325 [Bacillus subtilis]